MYRCDEVITKAREDDIAKIKALLDRVASLFRKAFLQYVETAASDTSLDYIIELLSQGRQGEINDYLAQNFRVFNGVVYDAMAAAGRLETEIDGARILAAANQPSVILTFDPGNPRAATIVQQQASRLIREVTQTQRNIITQIVSEGSMAGEGPVSIARKVRENIGLTSKQYEAVSNYERLLREGNAAALDRDLRDRRYDRSVQNAADKPLTEEQIKRMTDRYRERYVQYRAETIARTESGEAVNNGRQEAMLQNLEAVGLTENDVIKTWVSIRDRRTRWSHNHSGLGGKKVVGLNTPFVSPTGARMKAPGDRSLGAGGGDVINCRCSVTYRVISPS